MNKELLLKVKQHILEEPARLRMSNWIRHGEPGCAVDNISADWGESSFQPFPACGTVGCIAGWTVILAGIPEEDRADIHLQARDLLGLEPIHAYNLFYVSDWPYRGLRDAYYDATTQEERAKIVAQVIDNCIADSELREQEKAPA